MFDKTFELECISFSRKINVREIPEKEKGVSFGIYDNLFLSSFLECKLPRYFFNMSAFKKFGLCCHFGEINGELSVLTYISKVNYITKSLLIGMILMNDYFKEVLLSFKIF